MLGAVQGAVGRVDQLPRFRAGAGQGRGGADADGDAGTVRALARQLQPLYALADAFGHDGHALERLVRQDDGKLFAAIAGHHVVRAHFAGHGAGHLAQAQVAALVAVAVVVFLEIVDIDHQQRQGLALPLGALPLGQEGVVEAAPVRQARQAIARGQAL